MKTIFKICITKKMKIMIKKNITFKYQNRYYFLSNNTIYIIYIFFIEDNIQFIQNFFNFDRF